MEQDVLKILLTEQQIRDKVAQLGAALTEEYRDKNPIFIGILRGVVVFFSDILRQMPIYCDIDFMAVSSYGSGTTSGRMKIEKDLSLDIRDRHVVILEDILDTGRTLRAICDMLWRREPASLKICALLDKPSRRTVDIQADYVGFQVPDEFVVGYGLDFDDHYRNLPYIGILKPEIYAK